MPNDYASFAAILTMLGLLAASSCCGCGAITRQVARDATPLAIDSGIEAGLSEKNQEAVVQALDPERIERATEKVAGGATDGWTRALAEDQRQERIVAAVKPIVASLVSESIEVALTDEHLTRVRGLAKQATLGFQDAIDEVAEKRDRGVIPADQGNVLEAVDELAEGGRGMLYVLGAIALGLAALLGLGTVWALARKRRFEREAARQGEAFAAAVRMLSREQRPSTEVRADAELVRSAALRMGGERTQKTG
jgi:hypothetical protein